MSTTRGRQRGNNKKKPPRSAAGNNGRAGRNIKKTALTYFFGALIAVLTLFSSLFTKIKRLFLSFDARGKIIAASSLGVAVIVIVTVLVFNFSTRINGYEIYLNDNIVGIVKMSRYPDLTGDYVMKQAMEKLESEISEKVECHDKVSVIEVHASGFVTLDYAVSQIYKKLEYKVRAAVITVDGVRMVVIKNEEEAQSVLQAILDEYYQEGLSIAEAGFVEDVAVTVEFLDASTRVTSAGALEILTSKTAAEEYYTIKSGDNLINIAARHDMKLERLLEMNPGIGVNDVLHPGQTLLITKPQPVLSVRTVEPHTYISVVEYATQTIYNPDQPKSYSKIIQQGRDGQEEVRENIIRVNGSITEREIISKNVTVDPVAEIVEVGTKQ